ncbi:MAG: response regulator transcription factor, partial [Pseudomonadota bacterium]
DLQLVGSAATYREAEQLLQTIDVDLVLLDLQLDEQPAFNLIPMARQQAGAQVLILSALGDEVSVVRAIRAGADGYLLKDATINGLGDAILEVSNGGSPLTPAIARHLIREFRPSEGSLATERLTAREMQVLKALASGYTYKEVAAEFGLSYHTVVDYTRSLYRKLNVNSRTEAVVAGAQRGLISL